MLTKPPLEDQEIINCLENTYGLTIEKISFLPLGADLNTAVYRVTTGDKTNYFLKLRSGEFNEASVLVPKYLADHGLKQVIPPPRNQRWAIMGRLSILQGDFISLRGRT
jgi:spectinomycin phosphotransferase